MSQYFHIIELLVYGSAWLSLHSYYRHMEWKRVDVPTISCAALQSIHVLHEGSLLSSSLILQYHLQNSDT